MTQDAGAEYFKILEAKAWENYKKSKYFYHVTHFDNLDNIMDEGLIGSQFEDESDQKAIFFFTQRKWSPDVAASILLPSYCLFRIRKSAIPKELIRWDNVAEHCAVVSFYALIDAIPKEDISFVDCYHVVRKPTRQTVIYDESIPFP